MALTERPAAWRAVMADSRPAPGPLTRTSISLRPNLVARSAAISAARWAANGVLLRLPLNPTVPAEAKHNVSPLVSVMVTMVLLKVALIWATPRLTLRRALRFLLFAMAQFRFQNADCRFQIAHLQSETCNLKWFTSRGVP